MFFRKTEKKTEAVAEITEVQSELQKKTEKRRIAGFHDATEEGIPMIGKIVIALLLVGVLFVIWGVQNGIFSNAQNKITGFGDKMNTSTITQYENKTITGATLQAYLTEVVPTLKDAGMGEGTSFNGIKVGNTGYTKAEDLSDPAKKFGDPTATGTYINPTKKYYCTVTRNAEGVITDVTFTTS